MKTDEPLITVVVPVYQTCEFLRECVESVQAQTYKNLEIILVDDGSRDGAGSLCDEYADQDFRIHVIHQKNHGLMAARNTGMDYGKGMYFAFVDSDDAVSPVYIEKLYRLVTKYNADIGACAFERNRAKVVREDRENFREICMSSSQMLRRWHGRYKKYETVIWNKLYRESVLKKNGIMAHFRECRRHEDVLVSHLLVQNAEKVALTACPLYFYRARENSITSEGISREKAEQNLSAQRERMDFFVEKKYRGSSCRLWMGYLLHRLMFAYQLLKH